ncbi:MAG TPA: small ribosomal subunit Rsm22 family protein [Candidatus Angelobacter sp.]|jgi:ribosomal protein RSM22 (predicted rRNA methylase)
MRLPTELMDAIEQETEKVDRRKLVQATAQLSQHYKAADFSHPAVVTSAHRAAYLAVRLPAIYAAVRRVLAELQLRVPQCDVRSLLDIGAGPGTVLFAASDEFHLQEATLIEVDAEWLAMGKRLAAQSPLPVAREAQWVKQDLRSGLNCQAHDLVTISYTFGELPPAAADAVLRKAWSCANQFLVIIEPGTPRGFAAVNAARTSLIATIATMPNAARIIAPCPHQYACPMAAAGDWCHFSQRIERTSLHRQLKGGTLGHEDEKFSYLIAAKTAVQTTAVQTNEAVPAPSRIVRHPLKHSGHVQLSLCTPEGKIENRIIARSSKAAYKSARKAEWGDAWAESGFLSERD